MDPAGVAGPTRGQSRSKRWRPVAAGWVLPSEAPTQQPGQRIIEAVIGLPDGGAVTAWASLHLAGAEFVDGTTTSGESLPVHLLAPGFHRPRPGSSWSSAALAEDEVVMRHGIRCTNIHRALLDAICTLGDLREAVVIIDMVLHAELTSLARFGAYLAGVPRRRGLRLARRALALAVEGSESPRETLMRLVWVLDAGLPPPLSNRTLWTPRRRFLARPDLLSPEAGVVAEYDGAFHLATSRRRIDITREERLRNHGLECITFVAGQLQDRESSARRMLAVVARAGSARRAQVWRFAPSGSEWSLDRRLELRASVRSPYAVTARDNPPAPPRVTSPR
ncbi:hypothetical protein ASG90_00725 [Nocardioides sp. Soil797]|nr:hypothetical protein ASG90_00725 [Nocardioides sp. Soil797]